MSVVVFFSGGASSMRAMLNDPEYGRLYRVSGAFRDRPEAPGKELCSENHIPNIYRSRTKFYRDNGLNPKDENSRNRYYEMVAREIEQFHPDVIALSGYMHIVSEPLLSEYANRILNVHPADLSIIDCGALGRYDASKHDSSFAGFIKAMGYKRKFTGDNTVYDAILAGENETRSTVHIAVVDADAGPIIVQSKPFEMDETIRQKALNREVDGIKEYASVLQERMKLEGDGPAYLKAIELVASGRLGINGDTIFLDGIELPYCGYRLD